MSFYRRYLWLGPLALFTAGLLASRMLFTGTVQFTFLLWNLLLAAVPLWAAHRLRTELASRTGLLWAGIWLLFFPNALYITTDLFHLRQRPGVPLWFDLLLLFSAAVNGALWGFLSLRDAEAWLRARLPRRWVLPVVFSVLLAAGFGIYLGRYLRYNSWDVLTQPTDLAAAIAVRVLHPFRHADAWAVSVGFALWSGLLYKAFRKWPGRRAPLFKDPSGG